ncbi:scavenger receptor cysteine-rich domain-containing group B protein [Lates japonicus]|uniref:Scavenger receptor cysteine-rich domain-containing group B protein n=1 Tax=Lates japonicus TaxID=270547 RepID=A0AAD3NM53_LATJO|nr:scavenger receptor cysteine-rich domain-containing group B protein [Lates japonicus]
MRGQRVVESECRCWNPAVWLLVSLLGSLVLVAVSVLLRLVQLKWPQQVEKGGGITTTWGNSVIYHWGWVDAVVSAVGQEWRMAAAALSLTGHVHTAG